MDTSHSVEGTAVGHFYDNLRRSALSSAALAHGEAYIGQDRLLRQLSNCAQAWTLEKEHI